MKTTTQNVLTICVLFFTMALPSNAQLKVQSNGYVMINNTTGTAVSPLSIGGTGNSSYYVSINNTGDYKGIYLKCNNYNNGIAVVGNLGKNRAEAGIRVVPTGVYSPSRYSIHSFTGPTYYGKTIGVAGVHQSNSNYTSNKVAGIYGSSSADEQFDFSGVYAGYFNGDARVTGTLYGTLLTPSASNSNGNYGEGTTVSVVNTDATDESKSSDENISDKLRHVQLLQLISHKERTSTTWTNKSSIHFPEDEDDTELTSEEFEKFLEENKGNPIVQTEMASTRYELAVDQLRDVFPELVYEDKDGNISINYMEMIPLLVQALKEQQTRIDILEGKTVNRRAEAASITTTDDVTLYLGQNNPNPFSEQTSIEVRIPNDVKTAFLCIYDMNGKQIDKIVIDERGTTRISILGTNLIEGMYLYSLITDGKVAGTKKMILTK